MTDLESIFGKANPPPGKKYDFTHAEAWIGVHKRGFGISWAANGVGFGEVYFEIGPKGQVHIDTEMMSDQFVEELLAFLVSKSTKDDEPAPFKTINDIFQDGMNADPGAANPHPEDPERKVWQSGYDLNNRKA